jgi:hypothetical protein
MGRGRAPPPAARRELGGFLPVGQDACRQATLPTAFDGRARAVPAPPMRRRASPQQRRTRPSRNCAGSATPGAIKTQSAAQKPGTLGDPGFFLWSATAERLRAF